MTLTRYTLFAGAAVYMLALQIDTAISSPYISSPIYSNTESIYTSPTTSVYSNARSVYNSTTPIYTSPVAYPAATRTYGVTIPESPLQNDYYELPPVNVTASPIITPRRTPPRPPVARHRSYSSHSLSQSGYHQPAYQPTPYQQYGYYEPIYSKPYNDPPKYDIFSPIDVDVPLQYKTNVRPAYYYVDYFGFPNLTLNPAIATRYSGRPAVANAVFYMDQDGFPHYR